ncbi:B12-binding domain-containing radical SAM protein [Candidatus Omnitrophota bacterium]
MKVVLVNLPWKSRGRTGVRAGSRWPHLKGPSERDYLPFPFFLAYAAAALKEHDFDVELIDAIAEEMPYSVFFRLIKGIKPDLLVCETSTVTLDHDLRLLVKIGRDISVVLCGPDVNIRRPSFLKSHPFVKYVLVGEYEFALLDLARHLREGKKLDRVAGLIFRDISGIKITASRPLGDLDQLPWPLRKDLPMERYNDTPGDMPLPSAQIMASRGCPYRCKFCLWPQVMYQGSHYRARDVVDVVDEMEYLIKEMKFKSIYFDDDTFNIGKARMLRLCDEMRKRKLNTPWAVMARADLMDEEILKNMRQAGLFAIKYGVESANQGLLDNIAKNMDLRKTESVIKFTKMLGIKTHLTFTFGLPGETKATIARTIDFALRSDPTTIQFSISTPFPGTAFYEEMKDKGYILAKDWSEYDGGHKSAICLENLSNKDLEQAIKSAYGQWANHCMQRRQLNKTAFGGYYYQLLVVSLKRYGFLVTGSRAPRFIFRGLALFLRGRFGYRRKEIERIVQEKGLEVGRLRVVFEKSGIALYWKEILLTRNVGLFTSIHLKDGQSHSSSLGCWDCRKTGPTELVLRTNYGLVPVQEVWRIEVIDEKQIDWNAEIEVEKDIEVRERRVAIILSERYRTWVDSWGEGLFPSLDDLRAVKTKNPNSSFVGLRGRKKLKGQLPTVLLDISNNNGDFSPSVKNAEAPLGARVIEARTLHPADNGKCPAGRHRLFSGRIVIVEEDFKKRKSARR